MGRGGARVGAGRPKGRKTRSPLGNRPAFRSLDAIVVPSEPSPEKSWRERNAEWVEKRLDPVLEEVLQKAQTTGDDRLAFAVLQFRASYHYGTPSQERRVEAGGAPAQLLHLASQLGSMNPEELKQLEKSLGVDAPPQLPEGSYES